MSDVFARAPDPDVFPPEVSQFSVFVPSEEPSARCGEPFEWPAALAGASAKRRREFLAGRLCARRAIERLAPHLASAPLRRDADGAPIWPDGFVGSIAHAGRYATAAVARSSQAFGLGVDAEPVMSEAAAADVAGLVASEAERRLVSEALGIGRLERAAKKWKLVFRKEARGSKTLERLCDSVGTQIALEALTLVFSIKESVFKALYPATRRHFDYLDCAILRVDPEIRVFAVRFPSPFEVEEVSGRYELSQGEVRTGAFVPSGAVGNLRRA